MLKIQIIVDLEADTRISRSLEGQLTRRMNPRSFEPRKLRTARPIFYHNVVFDSSYQAVST
jgi:hypothetical protein